MQPSVNETLPNLAYKLYSVSDSISEHYNCGELNIGDKNIVQIKLFSASPLKKSQYTQHTRNNLFSLYRPWRQSKFSVDEHRIYTAWSLNLDGAVYEVTILLNIFLESVDIESNQQCTQM